MSLLRLYYVSTLEFSLRDRTLPFVGSYPAAIERERNGKKYRLGHRGVNTLERRTHQSKKNGRLTFATRVREGRGGGEEARKRWAFRRESRGEFEHDRLGPISRFSPDMPSAEWQMEAAHPVTRLRLSLRLSSVSRPSFPSFSALFAIILSFSLPLPPLPHLLSSMPLFRGSSSRMPRLCPRKSITSLRRDEYTGWVY